MEIQWENVHALIGLRGKGNSLEQCLKYYDPESGATKIGWFKVNETAAGLVAGPPTKRPGRIGYRDYDWAGVNWDKTNAELSNETGIHYQTVGYYRTKVGHPSLGRSNTRDIAWRELDWDNKHNAVIAKEIQRSISLVRNMRIRLGYPHVPPANKLWRKISQEQIDAVDWINQRDADLARQWGVTRERVRQLRIEGGYPACRLHCVDTKLVQIDKWLMDNRPSIEGKIAKMVAEQCPVVAQMQAKYRVMKRTDIKFLWKAPESRSLVVALPINWALPNKAISLIWKMSSNWISNGRHQYSKRAPKYQCRGGRSKIDLVHHFQNPEFTRLVIEDIKKAQALGIKPDIKKLAEYGLPVISHNHTTNNDTKQTDPIEHSSSSAESEGAS